MFDLRGAGAVMVCPCGSQMWELAWVIFDDEGIISAYSEHMKCHVCGTIADAPMPGVNTGE